MFEAVSVSTITLCPISKPTGHCKQFQEGESFVINTDIREARENSNKLPRISQRTREGCTRPKVSRSKKWQRSEWK